MATMGTAAAVRAAPKAPTVLVVDDERVIRDLLSLHLRNAGYAVVLAQDAIEAGWRLLERTGDIDLLVVDAQLPYFSGIEFASTLIADSSIRALPLILITGHEHLVLHAERLGLPCLLKPFSADLLVSMVETCLGERAPAAAALMEVRTLRRA